MISILTFLVTLIYNPTKDSHDEVEPKREPAAIACGQTPHQVVQFIGQPDEIYRCYENEAHQYGQNLMIYREGHLVGTVPMYSYFDKCIDHRAVNGFYSVCSK